MSAQADLFADGSADSMPPWQDPELVDRVTVEEETDRDHVGEAAIGRVGNNRALDVVKVWGKDGSVLYSEPFQRRPYKSGDGSRSSLAAITRASVIRGTIALNRQARLF